MITPGTRSKKSCIYLIYIALTLIGYPGAIFVGQILFSFLSVEMYRSIFLGGKNQKILEKKLLKIVKLLDIFWENGLKKLHCCKLKPSVN